jgi:uncharacterized protein (TIGR03437 family)
MNRLTIFLLKLAFGAILAFLACSSAVYAASCPAGDVCYTITGTLNLTSGDDMLGLSGSQVIATATINPTMVPSATTPNSNTYSVTGVGIVLFANSANSSPFTCSGASPVTLTDNSGAPDTIGISCSLLALATVTANVTIPTGYMISDAPGAIPSIGLVSGTVDTSSSLTGDVDFSLSNATVVATGVAPPVVTPNPTAWTPSAAEGSTVSLTQPVTFTLPLSPAEVSFTTSSSTTPTGQTWLSVAPSAANTTSPAVTITANPTGLTAGTYNGTVTLSFGSSGVASIAIPVTFTVTPPPVTLTGPTGLTFNYTLGDASGPATQTLTIGSSPASSTSVSASVTSGSSWLSISGPAAGTTPANFTIAVNTTGLTTAQVLTGNIQITAAGAANSPFNVPVTYNVLASTLTVPTTPLTFNYTIGSTAPTAQLVSITGTSGISYSAAVATTSGGSWLAATPGGPVASSLSVSINSSVLSGLTAGSYGGTVTVTSTGATGSGAVIPITLKVSGPTLTASPSQLNFTYQLVGGTTPASQSITVGDASNVNFTATPLTTSGGSWLSVNPGSGSASGSIGVSVNPASLAAGVYNGTVTIAATGATSQVVNVTLTVAAVTVSTNTLSFAFQIGGTAPTAQTVTIGGTPGLTFGSSVVTTTGGSWLSATAVSPGAIPGTLSVSVTPGTLTAGPYSGTVTVTAPGAASQQIAVTFTVSNSPTISASPSTLSFAYTLGAAPPATQSISVGGSSGLAFNTAVATTSGGAWLSASPVSPGTIPGSATVSIVTAALTTAGTYSGTVTISATGATSQVVTITLVVSNTLTAAPSTLSFAYTLGGTAPAAQSISVGGTAGISFTSIAATSSGGSWLSASPVAPGTVPGSASVSIVTSALTTAGTYTGTVTIGNANATSQVVNVTIVVGNSVTAAPSSLTFAYTIGGAVPAAQSINVTGTSGIAFTANVATVSGGSWLAASPVAPGTISGTASVSIVTSVLTTPGTFKGTVTIGAANATSQVVNITLVVSGALTATPTSLSFNYTLGGAAPAAQTITVGGSNGLAFTAVAATMTGGSWLAASPVPPGTAPGSASVSIVASALTTAGTYTGTVTIGATGAASQVVAVTIVVSNSLTATPSALNFTYTIGGTAPASQTLSIGGTSGIAFTASAATTSGGSWLSATAAAPGTISGSVSVSIVASVLTTAGTYGGTVTITAPNATSVVVPVSIVVSGAQPITASPTSLTFTYTIGSSTQPMAQGLNISGTTGSYTASAGSATWLSVSTGASGTLPALLSISVSTTGLAAGTYTGSIAITAAGASNSPFAVAVTLKISAGPSTITVSPSSLSFSANIGGTAPASQTVSVTGSSATAVTVSTIGGSWLGASISAGTTPAVVTVSASPAGLTAGTYTGTVVVTGAGATDSPQNIAVKLVISAITLTATPGSIQFAAVSGGANPASQSIGITATGTTSFTTSIGNGSWLTVTSSSAATPATLTLTANSTSLAPGTYTATVSILSPGATNSPLILLVGLVVSGKPTLTASPASLSFTTQAGGANPASQSISLSGGSAVAFTISTSPSWLSVSASANTTPSTLVATVNAKGISAGSYQGSITITSSAAGNSPVTIPVSFTVSMPLVSTTPSITAIVNAASYEASGFSPGAIVSIFGSLIGPQTGTSFSVNSKGTVDDTLAGVTVTVGGQQAIPLFVQNGQVNVILPYTLGASGQTNVQVAYNNLTSAEFNIALTSADVQIFTANASGSGPGSILNQDYSVNSAANPAAPGSVVQVFGTGGGALIPAVTAGDVAGDTLGWVAAQYSALVNGENATVTYAGSAPGLVYGVYQFNVQLPSDLPAGAATIVLRVGASASQSDVTVFVK